MPDDCCDREPQDQTPEPQASGDDVPRGAWRKKRLALLAVVILLPFLGIWCWKYWQNCGRARWRQQRAARALGLEVEDMLDLGGGVTLKLVLIPAGEFMMGSPPEEPAREGHEGPQHRVRITRAFYMGATEVTQAQYEAMMGTNPAQFKGAQSPVERAVWNDAAEFCRRLSAKTGRTVRLPTEAEWEYACRAGTTTPFHTGATITTDQANYDGRLVYPPREPGRILLLLRGYVPGLSGGGKGLFRRKTVAVGRFAPNAWGLHDMHGNVAEWCQDWYDGGYYGESPTSDPQGPTNGTVRVLRGGLCLNYPQDCRSADRREHTPGGYWHGTGFRVVVAVGED